MDERSSKIVAGAMGITLGLLYLFLIGFTIWKYVTTKDITNCTLELILIVLIPLSITWFARNDESLLIPRMTTTGKELPTEQDVDSKQQRKKAYVLDSTAFATVLLILTMIDAIFIQKEWYFFPFFPQAKDAVNIILTHALEFFLGLIIFYTIRYVWDEWKVKRYENKLKELGETDE